MVFESFVYDLWTCRIDVPFHAGHVLIVLLDHDPKPAMESVLSSDSNMQQTNTKQISEPKQ